MAFGFGFNKQKVLSAAEKYVQQGKLQNAIAEYEKILKADPKDLTVMNTVGDLYARNGEVDKATECFKSVGDAYAAQGFTVKGIAMYKKIGKLKPSLESVLKLAELYTQQGLFNDARAQYLQVAEEFLRARNALESGDAASAIPLFQKVTDLDNHADGLRDLLKAYLQSARVAEGGSVAAKLLALHNDVEPMFAYIDALVQSGGQEEAVQLIEEHCDRLLAENSAKVLETLRAVIGPLGNNPTALEKVTELFHKAGDQSHLTEVHELLAHAYVQSGEFSRARDLYQGLAEQEPQNPMHMQNYQQVVGMMGGSSRSKLLSVEEGIVLVEELEATTPPVDQPYSPEVANALRAALTDTELFMSYNMPDKALGPLMSVLPIAPTDVRLNQRLAALYTRSERFADAAACCRTLASVYHESGLSEEGSRYDDLARRCEERATSSPTPAPAPADTDATEIPMAPWPLEAADATQEFAITEEPAVVEGDQPAEFETLTHAPSSSEIDLSDEWEGALTSEAPELPVAASTSVQGTPVEPAVEEISIESSDAVAETIEEVRFYLEHSMVDQARAAYVKLQTQTADYEQLAAIKAEIDAASTPAAPEVEAAVASAEAFAVEPEPPTIAAEPEPDPTPEPASPLKQMVADLDSSLGESFLPQPVTHEIEQEQEIVAHAATDPSLVSHLEFMSGPKLSAPDADEKEAEPGVLGEFVADLEDALGDGFLQEAPVATPDHPTSQVAAQPEPAVAHAELHMAASAMAGSAPASQPPAPSPAAPPVMAAAAAPVSPTASAPATFHAAVRPLNGAGAASVDLADMFGEIRHELEEEVSSADEDPETHYNLGVAFREMGLLDEAIGELQKVCQAIDHGSSFAQVMQTYTWLAQCFLDKGVPEAAIRWYEKALKLPSLDQETRTALHYELASSYESAQDRSNALQHFMEVYGSNIDYRDVGERIRALKS